MAHAALSGAARRAKRSASGRQALASARADAKGAGLASPAARAVRRIGQNVQHPKFGSGVIVDAEGHGNDARVQVNFGGRRQMAGARLRPPRSGLKPNIGVRAVFL